MVDGRGVVAGLRGHWGAALVAGLLATVGTGALVNAHGGDPTLIHSCASTSTGAVRFTNPSTSTGGVGRDRACAAGEVAVDWGSSVGIQGVSGPSGVANAWLLTGNAGTTPPTNFLGTTDNQPLELHVNGQRAFRLEPALSGGSPAPNVVGGFGGNTTGSAAGATIAGGGSTGFVNQATGNFATVGGGRTNTASGGFATVGGGVANTASGQATVGGGFTNTASGQSSTVGGGFNNTASDGGTTVGGGGHNTASGNGATVPGGGFGQALGSGTFVWNDVTLVAGNPFTSNTALGAAGGQFNINASRSFHARATGGARFVTNANATTGVYVAPGGTSWTAGSHSSLKEHFASVDGRALLERLAALPITSWNLKSQDPSVRHLGPMAEEFYAAFGLGDTEQGILSTDADGVAFAAIQGLYALVQEQDALLAAQAEQAAAQAAQLATRDARVDALEAANAALAARLDAQQATLAALVARLAAPDDARGGQ